MSKRSKTIFFLSILGLIALIAVVISMRPKQGVEVSANQPADQTPETATEQVGKIGFNAHIRPILSDKCFACHGFDSTKREENLRLDTAEGAYAALDGDPSQFAIVPGNPKRSVVWQRIMAKDDDDIMPPPDYHKPLTDKEKDLITRWIEQGAVYQEHWAFAAVKKSGIPSAEAKHPIDAFIRKNLRERGLSPAPKADKATLLRRLSLDLIGLPPTPAELESFLSDNSADAYEKQVERLLDSKHYGERMAVHWLDAVRYADTVGYHGDQNARIFPYRDYVIHSFNDNKPFDVFTREQLAGDLMANPTDDQLIATGFLRLNLMTREGGAQDKEYLAKSASDRVRAIGGAWLGLTTGCSECHDHKFDPITLKDFYSMAAFFGDVRQWGIYTTYSNTPNKDLPGFNNESPFPPEIFAPNRAMRERLNHARDLSILAMANHESSNAITDDDFSKWINDTKAFLSRSSSGWLAITPKSVSSSKGTDFIIQKDATVLFTGQPKADDQIILELPMDQPIRSILLEVLPDAANMNRVGRSADGKFTMAPKFEVNGKPLEIAYQQADRRHPAKYTNGYQSPLLEETWKSAPALWEEPSNAATMPHHAIYHLAATTDQVTSLTLKIASADLGKIRVSVSPFVDPIPGEEKAMRPQLVSALGAEVKDQPELKAAYLLSRTPDQKLPANYKKAREQILATHAGYSHSMVAQALSEKERLTTRILNRGDWMSPGDVVEPALPAHFTKSSPSDGKRLNRTDLAEWLLSSENPLTRRHFVNRLWKQFFGKGFSNILDDIGNQGEWPSHPELIDWMAAEFKDSGWNVKHMVRLIVTSETYQQASALNPELAEIDPDNRLLSEQSARRLEAEFIRDNALAISGLLHTSSIGGPSMQPYQPDDYWANLNFPERKYQASAGFDQYRRGLYTHWQRTFIHPMLAAFDAPSREECAADRFQSNSPQQALTLLNDPTFVEAANALAARLEKELPQSTDGEKIKRAYLLALSREPKAAELEHLEAFLIKMRKDKPDENAMQQLCRIILNLHETITRY